MFRYIGKVLDDPLFLRVGMALWSVPMFLVAGFFAYDWKCGFEVSWFLLIPTAALLMGLWLLYSAVFVGDSAIQRLSDRVLWREAGIPVVTIVLVAVAVPIYELLKLARQQDKES